MIIWSESPALEHLLDLVAQVNRQFGMGIGNGLVLAYQAAQLGGDAQHAGLEHRIFGRRRRLFRLGPSGEQRQGQDHYPSSH
jgi:hypothetical protein